MHSTYTISSSFTARSNFKIYDTTLLTVFNIKATIIFIPGRVCLG